MLRGLVLLVLLANALLFAWGAGYLAPLAAAPGPQREPERVANQVNAEKFKLVGAVASAPASATASEPVAVAAAPASAPVTSTACLVSPANAPALSKPVQDALVAAGYSAEVKVAEGREGAQFMVYMGKLPSEAAVRTKLAELRGFGVTDFAAINDAARWQPGISLGVYASRERAEVRLKSVTDDGVRSAKIVERNPGTPVVALTLPAVAEADRAKFNTAVVAAGAKALQVCAL
jgi:hypothetical protein